jgi:hypothetical protein
MLLFAACFGCIVCPEPSHKLSFLGVAMTKITLPKEFVYLSLYLLIIAAINLPQSTILQVKHFFGFL